jgi:hypothetical protein
LLEAETNGKSELEDRGEEGGDEDGEEHGEQNNDDEEDIEEWRRCIDERGAEDEGKGIAESAGKEDATVASCLKSMLAHAMEVVALGMNAYPHCSNPYIYTPAGVNACVPKRKEQGICDAVSAGGRRAPGFPSSPDI